MLNTNRIGHIPPKPCLDPFSTGQGESPLASNHILNQIYLMTRLKRKLRAGYSLYRFVFIALLQFLIFFYFQTTISALTCSQENWVSAATAGASSDAEYELKHRRQLVEKWASATQEFRDVNIQLGHFGQISELP